MFAGEIRRKRVQHMRQFTYWRWRQDEVYVKVNGEMRYLWRAVDHEGEVLESFVTNERNKAAALKFIKKAMKRHGRPQAIATEGLRSYGPALKKIGAADRQEAARWINNRAEHAHLPFRRREREMARFRRMKTLQKFTSVRASVHNHFAQERHLVSCQVYKERRAAALAAWQSAGLSPVGLGLIARGLRQVAVGLTAPNRMMQRLRDLRLVHLRDGLIAVEEPNQLALTAGRGRPSESRWIDDLNTKDVGLSAVRPARRRQRR